MRDLLVEKKLETLTRYAQVRGLKIAENAEEIVKKLVANNGNCPCRVGKNPCPCRYHMLEIKEDGKCYCGLFLRKEEDAAGK